jgi:hypothetical protein
MKNRIESVYPNDLATPVPENFTLQVQNVGLTGDKEMDQLLTDCIATLKSKGAEYTMGNVDRLHNFRTVGEFTGVGMMATWGVYFYKHVSSLFSYIKNGGEVKSNEPISSRIMDCIVYLLLFHKMTQELERKKNPPF